MNTGVFWGVFENTGSIEAYLTYCKTEEVVDTPLESEAIESNSFEGAK